MMVWLTLLGAVCGGLLGVVALHVGYMGTTRAGHRSPWVLPVLMSVVGVGIIAYAGWHPSASGGAWVLRGSAILLYLAGCVIYVELRAVLSRGYSLRILLDLLEQPADANLDSLRVGYGQGAGLQGMLRRRVETLVRLHLVDCEGTRVGPLTPRGRLCGRLTAWMRRTLRLGEVG